MKNILLIFCILLLGLACETTSTEQPPVVASKDTTAIAKSMPAPSDWICIPNEKVGVITEDSDEKALIAAYGKEQVIRKDVGRGEGVIVAASIVFPDTPNELVVEWQEDFEYKKVSRISIQQEGAEWHTPEGIKIGTSLDQLVELNGKDFFFYGFEWDYGGITNDWDGGNINKQLVLTLDPKKPNVVYPDLLGEKLFSSSLPKAKEAELMVNSMVIHFGL